MCKTKKLKGLKSPFTRDILWGYYSSHCKHYFFGKSHPTWNFLSIAISFLRIFKHTLNRKIKKK